MGENRAKPEWNPHQPQGSRERQAGSTPGWGKSGEKCHLSQIRAPSHTGFDDVGLCLSDLGRPPALDESQGTFKTRRSKLFALKQEVVRRGQLWHHERRPLPSSRQSCLRARKLCSNSTAFIMAVIEATQAKSPATLLEQSIMPDACRDMRSRRARCLCCR